MDMNVDIEVGVKLLLSFLIGTLIGFEREYHSKAAGLRTMIMICLGSTIFTEISVSVGGASPDRIASNIITGVGFLGAGVIFKDGLTISGITTATTIWISSALGMAVGAGEYFIAVTASIIVLVVLVLLQQITLKIERFHQARTYRISYHNNQPFVDSFEQELKRMNLGFQKKKDMKRKEVSVIHYEIFGTEKKLETLNQFLKDDNRVNSFEY
jgi:putative Mg2+ transporter-C (MgtC) family protein